MNADDASLDPDRFVPVPSVRPPVVDWRPVGTDPRYLEIKLNRTSARRGRLLERLVLTSPVFVVVIALIVVDVRAPAGTQPSFWRLDGGNILLCAFLLGQALYEGSVKRTRVRVDPAGLSVRNVLRTERVLWADLSDVVLDGYSAVTLLGRDRVISCDALRVAERAWLPVSLGRRREIRAELDAVRLWLLEARATMVGSARPL